MERVAAPKKLPSRVTSWPGTAGERGGFGFRHVAPHLASSRQATPARTAMTRRGRPPALDVDLLGAIQALIADLRPAAIDASMLSCIGRPSGTAGLRRT